MSKIYTLFIIIILLAGVSPSLLAQDLEDPKYLEGAVPEVNGKVVFSRDFNIPGMSKDEIMSRTETWIDGLMKQNNNNSRIVFTDVDNGNIVASADHYIVFSTAAFSLDRTRMIFILTATAKPESLKLDVDKIRYIYNEGGKEETYTAEEMISDGYALNKTHTKLLRGYAKWRRKTVDYVDSLYLGAVNMLRATEESRQNEADIMGANRQNTIVVSPNNTEKPAAAPTPVETKPVETAVVKEPEPVVEEAKAMVEETKPVVEEKKVVPVPTPVPVAVAESEKPSANIPDGYQEVDVNSIAPEAISAGKGKLVIAIGTDIFNMTTLTAEAGGSLGKQQDKSVVYTILTPEQDATALKKAETYSVRFYPNGSDKPTVIFDCKKLPSQPAMEGMPQMFAGEVERVIVSQ